MGDTKPTVVVTGISGNLGTRLLPQLAGFNVIGVDVAAPATDLPLQFERMDLGRKNPAASFFIYLRDTRAQALVHLAFILDPVRAGVLDVDRMWQINVAGTARVMEAITEANHDRSDRPEICFSQQRFGLRIGLDRTCDRGASVGRSHSALRDSQDGMPTR